MKKIGFLMLVLLFMVVGCAQSPDPTSERAMGLNNVTYRADLGEARAFVEEYEVGMGSSLGYYLLFPAEGRGAPVGYGLEVRYDPAQLQWGEEMPFGPAHDNGIEVTFYPVSGHRMNDGELLLFGTFADDAGGVIRFEKAESHLGGVVRGELLEARLYGRYEDVVEGGFEEPDTVLRLELWNFPFDATLEDGVALFGE